MGRPHRIVKKCLQCHQFRRMREDRDICLLCIKENRRVLDSYGKICVPRIPIDVDAFRRGFIADGYGHIVYGRPKHLA